MVISIYFKSISKPFFFKKKTRFVNSKNKTLGGVWYCGSVVF
jgi:hypothetical protein